MPALKSSNRRHCLKCVCILLAPREVGPLQRPVICARHCCRLREGQGRKEAYRGACRVSRPQLAASRSPLSSRGRLSRPALNISAACSSGWTAPVFSVSRGGPGTRLTAESFNSLSFGKASRGFLGRRQSGERCRVGRERTAVHGGLRPMLSSPAGSACRRRELPQLSWAGR